MNLFFRNNFKMSGYIAQFKNDCFIYIFLNKEQIKDYILSKNAELIKLINIPSEGFYYTFNKFVYIIQTLEDKIYVKLVDNFGLVHGLKESANKEIKDFPYKIYLEEQILKNVSKFDGLGKVIKDINLRDHLIDVIDNVKNNVDISEFKGLKQNIILKTMSYKDYMKYIKSLKPDEFDEAFKIKIK